MDKLRPDDPRVESRTAVVNGKTYHYLYGEPPAALGTVLLLHGFPDLSFGWRYQVPFLLARRLRVIVPDMLGYGLTDAPEALSAYSARSLSEDMAGLVRQILPEGKVMVGAHDWGGFLAWRLALWRPDVVQAVFSVCTPYSPPRAEWLSPEAVTALLPNFAYQMQFAGPDVEAAVVGRGRLRNFLCAMHSGARGPAGEAPFSTATGFRTDLVDQLVVSPSAVVAPDEADFYADRYARRGNLRGPLNWYRTRRVNYDEELPLTGDPERTRITVPSLMITASSDAALPPAMAAGMERHVDDLETREVAGTHWVLWQAPQEVNRHIGAFLDRVGQGEIKAAI